MTGSVEAWLDNGRGMRLAYFGAAVLVSMLVGGYFILTPIVQAPALVSVGGAIIAAQGLYFILHAQPVRIGVARDALVVVWVLRRREIPFDSIARAVFVTTPKYSSMDWSRRFYSMLVHQTSGRKIRVGGLDGPVARRLMGVIPDAKREEVIRGR